MRVMAVLFALAAILLVFILYCRNNSGDVRLPLSEPPVEVVEQVSSPQVPLPDPPPIRITTLEQLALIGNSPEYPHDGHYVLMNDLDASETATWNEGRGWRAIGIDVARNSFTGVFDGQGHTISGLTINNMEEPSGGLFGSVPGLVKNLNVFNVNIRSQGPVGGLARGISGAAINCHTSGTVTGFNTVGGLVGTNPETPKDTRIIGCSSSCLVVLEENDGADGTYAGGLIGASFATVKNCFASGDVVKSGNHRVYMVGSLIGELAGSVFNCYATGTVVESETGGGLVGVASGTVRNAYYTFEHSGYTDTGKGTPISAIQLLQENTFEGWDFTDTWVMGNAGPELRRAF